MEGKLHYLKNKIKEEREYSSLVVFDMIRMRNDQNLHPFLVGVRSRRLEKILIVLYYLSM